MQLDSSIFRKTIFQPPVHNMVHNMVHNSVLVSKTTRGVPIDYLFINPVGSTKKVILFSHGNAEDITSCREWFTQLANVAKVKVMLYDYPGYGRTAGKLVPSEAGCYDAISHVYHTLLHNTNTKDIILMGSSLGSGPTCYLAQTVGKKFAGVILESSFLSCAKIMTGPHLDILGDMDIFKNEQMICDVQSPVLILHGGNDKLVSSCHAKKLFYKHVPERFRYHLCIVPDRGHNNLRSSRKYLHELLEFISLLEESSI